MEETAAAARAFEGGGTLADSEARFRTIVENLSEGLVISDLGGHLLHWNLAALRMHGFTSQDEVRRKLPEFSSTFTLTTLDGSVLGVDEWPLSRLIRGEEVRDCELRVRRNGTDWERIFSYGGSIVRSESDGRPILAFLTVTDVTERKRTDLERQATIDFLHLVSESRSTRDMVRSALEYMQRLCGCEAAGVRLREGDEFPYYEVSGFPPVFAEPEHLLCPPNPNGRAARDDDDGAVSVRCLCRNVIAGRVDPGSPFYTRHGSVITRSAGELAAAVEQATSRPMAEGGCYMRDFESVALIPLRLGAEPLGLVHLMDRRQRVFAPETVALCERLADALAMAIAKSRAEEALRRALADLQAAGCAAEEARTAAVEANQAKDHFLAVLSHELRTPLTPVLTGLVMLETENGLSDRAKTCLEVIRRNVELESRLIDDLLDLTRVARGRIDLDKRPVSVDTIIERAVEVCRPDIEARDLRFTVVRDRSQPPSTIEADAARIQQVVWNLLKNAVKFTPPGGEVKVVSRADRGWATVEVSDTGIGIEPAVLPTVFDAFVQAGGAAGGRFGGLGLGLAISKALVEMHGGAIEGESAGPGRGATFRVRLPLAKTGHAGSRDEGQPPRTRAPLEGRRLRVLLVEDHADTLDLLSQVLELEGHTVGRARDMASALKLADASKFDVLISDLGLPDGSGIDLVRELRVRGHDMPAIALSGYGQEQDVERSLGAGFRTHLVKPAEPRLLIEAMAHLTA
ncbi:MAG: ATP-binding protein [Vicinamibacterales bacterium]